MFLHLFKSTEKSTILVDHFLSFCSIGLRNTREISRYQNSAVSNSNLLKEYNFLVISTPENYSSTTFFKTQKRKFSLIYIDAILTYLLQVNGVLSIAGVWEGEVLPNES
eukprot:snap_masked-scaffold_28-processed-gene-3.52-mRNA-1 protein AED:1.00 eAED:1.00 QI:0/0/0/0/1/1/5/0/108